MTSTGNLKEYHYYCPRCGHDFTFFEEKETLCPTCKANLKEYQEDEKPQAD